MRGRPHLDHDVVPVADLDRLLAHLQRPAATVVLPAVVAHPLDVEVGGVGPQVGEAPGDVGVVADDHAGHAGEAEARDVERAVLADLTAVQADLDPDAGQGDPEVRVVGQDRRTAHGVLAADHPAVAADAVAVAEQRGHLADDPIDAGQRLLHLRPERRPLRQPGAGRGGVLLEDLVDDRALVDDRRVVVEGVRREQLARALGSHGADRPCPGDLVLEVALEVPRHRLEPGDRVDGGPGLGRVVEPGEVEDRVLERDLRQATVLEVGVDALGIGVEQVAGGRVEEGQLLLGDLPPPERPYDAVGLERVLTEELGQPARRRVPSYVHLEEALLRVHEALGQRQVVHRVGVDLGDALLVAEHLDLAVEARDLDLTGRLGPRAAYDGDPREQGQDQRQHHGRGEQCPPAHRGRPGARAAGGGGHGGRHCARTRGADVALAVATREC